MSSTQYAPLLFPELVNDGKWTIHAHNEQTHGATSLEKKTMSVPMGNTPIEEFVRMHEMAHVKWSPTFARIYSALTNSGFNPETDKIIKNMILMVEDGRVNYALRRAGLNLQKGASEAYDIFRAKSSKSCSPEHEAVFYTLVAQGYIPRYVKDDVRYLRQHNVKAASIMRRILKTYRKHYLEGTDCTIKVIKLLYDLWKENSASQKQQNQQSIPQIIVCEISPDDLQKAAGTNTNDKADSDSVSNQQQHYEPQKLKQSSSTITTNTKSKYLDDFVSSGLSSEYIRNQMMEDEIRNNDAIGYIGNGEWLTDLRIETPHLLKVLSKKPQTKHIYSDTGNRLRQAWRNPIDGMMFVESRKKFRTGSVLIDCSGSMNISVQEIERIVLACPGMLVAGYASCQFKKYGVLRIFAKNGKMCEDNQLDIRMGENLLDILALDWLSRQIKPRFWVSDGYVTGKSGYKHFNLSTEAFDFIIQHGILRVENLSSLEQNCLNYRIK